MTESSAKIRQKCGERLLQEGEKKFSSPEPRLFKSSADRTGEGKCRLAESV